MTVVIKKPAINLRAELASLRNQGGVEESKLYLDNLVTNGTFDSDSGWTKGTGWSISGGSASSDGTQASDSYLSSNVMSIKSGKSYVVSFDLTQTLGAVDLKFAGTTKYTHMSNGTFTYIIVANSNSSDLDIIANQYFIGSVDNISVQEVGENLVTNGTFDYDGGWTKGTGWTISGGTASCDGTQTSSTNLDDTRTAPLNASVVHIQFTLSGYTAGSVQPRITGGTTVDGTYVAGNGVKTVTLTDTGNNSRVRFTATSDFVGSIDNVILTEGNHNIIQSVPYGYDVKDVYIDGELAREGEGYDYQVKTDGINQWLKPTVEPTASTETVVIGVRDDG